MRNILKYALPALFLLIGGIYIAQSIVFISPEIALALVGGAILAVVSFFYPNIGVYFVLITLFFPEISLGSVGMGLTEAKRDIGIRPEDILIILIAAGWFARLVAKRREMLIPNTPVNTPILILSLVMVFTTMHGVLLETVPLSTGFFYVLKKLEYFVVFFMVITNINTKQEIKTGIAILLIASAIVAIWGTIEYTTSDVDLAHLRIAGPFKRSQANILGGFFVIIIFPALSFLRKYRSTALRIGLLVLIFLTAYAVIWTRSRSSYAAIFAGFIIFSLLIRKPLLLIIPSLLIILMPYLFPVEVQQTASSIRAVWNPDEVNPSWDARTNAWQWSWPKIVEQPVLGYGLGSFDLAWTDNQYATDLLYMGIVGLIVFLWIIGRLFRSVWGMHRDSPDLFNQALALGFICVLASLLIQGIAVAIFYTIRTMIPFWFLAGLVMAAYNLEEEQKDVSGTQKQVATIDTT